MGYQLARKGGWRKRTKTSAGFVFPRIGLAQPEGYRTVPSVHMSDSCLRHDVIPVLRNNTAEAMTRAVLGIDAYSLLRIQLQNGAHTMSTRLKGHSCGYTVRNSIKCYDNFDAYLYIACPLLVSLLRFPQKQKTARSAVFQVKNADWPISIVLQVAIPRIDTSSQPGDSFVL